MPIRPLTVDEVDLITRIDRQCFPPGIAFPAELFEQCLEDDFCSCLGMEKDGELVAFAIVSFPGPFSANIITIDVLPDHRRRGVADALMDAIMQLARARHVKRMVLQVQVDNEPARSLYLKRGFQVRSTLRDYYGLGKHALLMDAAVPDKQKKRKAR